MFYYKKYLKYKKKYLKYKNQFAGTIIEKFTERYDDHLTITDIEKIKPIAVCYNRYLDTEFFDKLITPNKYNDKETEFMDIKTFNDLLKYTNKLIKSLPPYGTKGHRGPLSNESSLILIYLDEFFKYDFITLDSQPGLIASDDNQVLRPYLFLYGSNTRIKNLYDIIRAHDFLAIVPYDPSTCYIKKEDYPSFTDIKDYTEIAIGTRFINEFEKLEDYYDKIFSDYFFIELLEIIKKI